MRTAGASRSTLQKMQEKKSAGADLYDLEEESEDRQSEMGMASKDANSPRGGGRASSNPQTKETMATHITLQGTLEYFPARK